MDHARTHAGWLRSGEPWVWLNAAAVAACLLLVFGLVALIAVRGLGVFWPADVVELLYRDEAGGQVRIAGEVVRHDRLAEADTAADTGEAAERWLLKTGNRDLGRPDYRWVSVDRIVSASWPESVTVVERARDGVFYGYLEGLRDRGDWVHSSNAWAEFEAAVDEARAVAAEITALRDDALRPVDAELERLRLRERSLSLEGDLDERATADLAARRAALEARHEEVAARLEALATRRDAMVAVFASAEGVRAEIPVAEVLGAYRPNAMGVTSKLGHYLGAFWAFVSDEPREANTEGGIFPAIFGTVLMVIVMSFLVMPLGVAAAVYLREYARQGWLTQALRVAVTNLAGVPSIVFGVFGLGFFIYVVGGSIDSLFYEASLPAPTFGTGGLFWASLTLALLTLPVVIVSTEEALRRIPRSIREGSVALGANRWETIRRTLLPMASPGIMTGLILAVARAAGEVAPLMLVGVVKVAPNLPVDGEFPFIHPERKFMHLGFHIYDLGFQSPDVEATRPLVFATAFVLLAVIFTLNLVAIASRQRLLTRQRARWN